jgi:hypothetical protein
MVEIIVDSIVIILFELLICFLVLNNKKED